jgi:putative tryptophan/tyrosine transport system substrate-binding protein
MRRRDFITGIAGSAGAWPLAARAQQPTTPVVGFMSARAPEDSQHLLAALRQGFAEGGFVEGKNVTIEYRWARGEYGRLPALAAELVNRRVSVLLGIGGDASALAAKAATSTIPIVFGVGGDAVKAGLVASYNRPGGNATGVSLLSTELEPKRIGVLNQLAPGTSLLGAVVNPKFPPSARQSLEIREAAEALRRPVVVLGASTDAELDTAFATLAERSARGLLMAGDPFFDTRRERIIALVTQLRVPAIYQFREYALAGGLMSYGVSLTDAYRNFGSYAAKILKGANPAELPVLQSVKFETVINLKAAKALGLEIPPSLSAQADEVIE